MEDQKRVEGDEVHGDKIDGDKVAGDKTVVSPHVEDVHDSTVIIAGRDVTYMTGSEREALNDYLARAVSAYEARMYQHLAPCATPPDQPYKFLYAFEIEDSPIFFGRDAASEDFYQAILKDRLTVLHAKSGAGKTSLLNAGLSPRLIREGRLPVYARSYEDPVLAIKRAIAPPSFGPWPELLLKLTLHEFLGLTCDHLSRKTQELVVILDQFEEFFVFWPERGHRQLFIDALADCYDDKSLLVRFVIALRKDYYSDLADFEERIRNVFHNQYRLDTMTHQEAQEAITRPVAKLGHPVTYEQDLLDTLLDDLARGGMELPHLQIICTRLYEALAKGETAITLTSYKKLGQAEGVLGGYLNSVLDRLPGGGEAIAREVLKELVSSEATKRVLGYDTLAARVEVVGDELDGVLARLVDARLLRRDEVVGEITYEMAHEYLVEEIKKWIDLADLEFKQAEELLMREVANWRVHGTLIPRERLELVYVQRERFRGLDDEAWECILRSALQADFAVEDWVKLAGEIGIAFISAKLDDQRKEMRLKTIEVLRQLEDPRAVELLITALGNEDEDVARVAQQGLVGMGQAVVGRLTEVFMSERGSKRRRVAEALQAVGEFPVDASQIGDFIEALADHDETVATIAQQALVQVGGGAVEPLMTALGDPIQRVRSRAASTLDAIGDFRVDEKWCGLLIAALGDEDEVVASVVQRALVRMREGAVEGLVTALAGPIQRVRSKAASTLDEIGDFWVNQKWCGQLITVLRDEDEAVASVAQRALVRMGEGAVVSLIAALEDDSQWIRWRTAEALGQISDARAIEPLINMLGDEDERVAKVAQQGLARMGQAAAGPLVEVFTSKRSPKRRWVAKALQTIGEFPVDASQIGDFIEALADYDETVAAVAQQALVRMGETAVEKLVRALIDPIQRVRSRTASTLEAIGDFQVDEEWCGLLTTALGDEDEAIASVAQRALVRMGEAATDGLLDVISTQTPSLRARIRAGNALGQIGDPRFHGPYLESELITIPAGEFWMGSESVVPYDQEKPAHKVHVAQFQMARYPVTNAQFKCFVDAGGYNRERYWTKAGWAWRQGKGEQYGRKHHEWLKGWEDGQFPLDRANHPVVNVTWYEALAYTRWLAEVTGKPYRLPTEAEWEKAAQGDEDKRWYPWGDEFDPKKANLGIRAERVGGTTPVGIYPDGASPYGIMDMSGNVWEWCSSLYRYYPYDPDDGREDLEAKGRRVLRGGSWDDDFEWDARCSSRYVVPPSDFYYSGFRVLVSAALSP